MKKKRLLLAIGIVCLLALGAVGLSLAAKQDATAFVGVPDTEESLAIQETIKRSYEIEAEAATTFDTSAFASIFINDSRGGTLIPSQLKFMQDITNDSSKTDFGYLEYKMTYFDWWGQGAIALEELQSKTESEGRNPSQEEMQSLIDSTGRMAPARSTSLQIPEIEFISITINDDYAIATFDDGPRTNEMGLVKVDGKWFIAGNKILSLHP